MFFLRPIGPSLRVMALTGATVGSGGDRCSTHHPRVVSNSLTHRLPSL